MMGPEQIQQRIGDLLIERAQLSYELRQITAESDLATTLTLHARIREIQGGLAELRRVIDLAAWESASTETPAQVKP